MPKWLRPFRGSESRYNIIYVREIERDVRRNVPESTPPPPPAPPPERVATTIQQVCSACGKFRSPSWSARHPLKLGETPRASLCKRCVDISTSSEDSGSRHGRKKHRRNSRTFTNSFEHSRSSEDIRRIGRRLRRISDSLSSDNAPKWRRRYRHGSGSSAYGTPRSRVGSVSTEGINIFIQSSPSESRPRIRTVSSSSESIHITQRASYNRSPRHGRTSSFEDVFASERFLPQRRSLSRARRGSRSSVHFEDEIERARVHPRSDSRSNESHCSGPVEDIYVTRSGTRIRRRPPINFDGVNDRRPDDVVDTQPRDHMRDQDLTQSPQARQYVHVKDQDLTQSPQPRQYVRSSTLVSNKSNGHANRALVNESTENCLPQASFQPKLGDGMRDRRSNQTKSEEGFRDAGFAPKKTRPLQSEDKGKSREGKFDELSYEIDSHTPTHPKVTSTYPAASKRDEPASFSLRYQQWSDQRDSQYSPLRPMRDTKSFSPALTFSDMQRQSPCRYQFSGHELMPDDPAHPDHLAYVMSGARITSVDSEDGSQHGENYSDRPQWDGPSSFGMTPDTPTPPGRLRRRAKRMFERQAGQSSSSEEEPRQIGNGDSASSGIDYEAEGRAWMEQVRRRQDAERERGGPQRSAGTADDAM